MAANVAGSMAGHYAGRAALPNTEEGAFIGNIGSSFAGGAAENMAREMMGIGGKRDWTTIATDAFGNALGNNIAQRLMRPSTQDLIAEHYQTAGKAQAAARIGAHYQQEGDLLRGNKHYNDVIKWYGYSHEAPEQIAAYGDWTQWQDAWGYEGLGAIGDYARYGKAWDVGLDRMLNYKSAGLRTAFSPTMAGAVHTGTHTYFPKVASNVVTNLRISGTFYLVPIGGAVIPEGFADSLIKGVDDNWDGQYGNYNVDVNVTFSATKSDMGIPVNVHPDAINGSAQTAIRANVKTLVTEDANGTITHREVKEVNVSPLTNGKTFAHELGHVLGLEDKYRDIQTSAGVVSIPFKGYENNLMGDAHNPVSRLYPSDIESVIRYGFIDPGIQNGFTYEVIKKK